MRLPCGNRFPWTSVSSLKSASLRNKLTLLLRKPCFTVRTINRWIVKSFLSFRIQNMTTPPLTTLITYTHRTLSIRFYNVVLISPSKKLSFPSSTVTTISITSTSLIKSEIWKGNMATSPGNIFSAITGSSIIGSAGT